MTRKAKAQVRALLGAVLLATSLVALGPSPARAATITVTTTEDEVIDDGDCSLREAVVAANTDTARDACPAGSGADTIDLQAGTYTLSIAGADENAAVSGDLDITDDLTILGESASSTVIDGNLPVTLDRVLDIDPGGAGIAVSVAGVRIQNGGTPHSFEGGGIRSAGDLTLVSSTVTGNNATSGGGIMSLPGSTLTLTDSIVSDNGAGHGGGIYLYHDVTATLSNSVVSGNTAWYLGGGIMSGGVVSLDHSSVDSNTAWTIGGGGIAANVGSVTLTNSTVSGNTSEGVGGGIFIDPIAEVAVTLNGSTVSGNTAVGSGGGLFNGHVEWTGTSSVSITNGTISGNSASDGGGIYNQESVALANTIVAGNTAPAGPQCDGTITSNGHNLDSGSSCGLGDPSDLTNTDPLLKPLANNGGPTETHALKGGSPARDQIPKADCGPTDQRGAPRQGPCDIGAYELVRCSGVVVNRVGTPGSDLLVGTGARDGVLGLGGRDTIRTKRGRDAVCAGAGADTVVAGGGKDKVKGQAGRDTARGGSGADLLVGGGGNDRLLGGGGNDTIKGGPGRDLCRQGAGTGPVRSCER